MPGSNADGTMSGSELALAIGELLRLLQMPRAIGLLAHPSLPGIQSAFDKVHGELAFGYVKAEEYAEKIKVRFNTNSQAVDNAGE